MNLQQLINTLLGAAPEVGKGLVRGVTADVVGGPVDTLNAVRQGLLAPAEAGNPYARQLGGLLGPVQQTGSSDYFAQQMGLPAGQGMAYEAGRMLSPSPADIVSAFRRAPSIQELITYHGTPHQFPATEANPLGEFEASKIGTGEGAQAFGHGIYLAENPAVAQDYQFMLSKIDPNTTTYQGKPVEKWYEMAEAEQDRAHRLRDQKAIDRANAKLAFWEKVMTRRHPEAAKRVANDPDDGWPALADYANSLDMSKFGGIDEAGSLYKADLPDEMIDRMLDWDKPLSEQPKAVQEALEKSGLLKGAKDYFAKNTRTYGDSPTGGNVYDVLKMGGFSQEEISAALSEAGIPGIKYLDQNSRDKGKGTSNFVVFPGEEKKVKILKRE